MKESLEDMEVFLGSEQLGHTVAVPAKTAPRIMEPDKRLKSETPRDALTRLKEHAAALAMQLDDAQHKYERALTDRGQLEESSRQQNERFRLIAENAADLIAVVDGMGQRLYNSPSYEKVLGYSQKELQENWAFAEIHADDRARVIEAAEEAFHTGIGHVLEFRMRHKDGSWRTLQSSSGVIHNTQGGIESLVIVAHDITERKHAEQEMKRRADEFAALYDTTRDLAEQNDLSSLLKMILDRASRLLYTPVAGIYIFDEEEGKLRLEAVNGILSPLVGTRMELGEGLAGCVAQSRRPMIVDNYAKWEGFSPKFDGFSISAALEVPMIYRGELIGVLAVNEIGETTRKFDSADIRLLELFAAQAANAVRNAKLFEQVNAGRERLQALSQSLIQAQEQERRHIARELHDQIGQVLTSVKTNLQSLQLLPEAATLSTHLVGSIETIDIALQQIRSISLDLHPSMLDDFGLITTLSWYIENHTKNAGLRVELLADPSMPRSLTNIETACFRVVQEALTNTMRHAHATKAIVQVKRHDDELELIVRDNGVGFDVDSARHSAVKGMSMGLLGMQERVHLMGGRIDIQSLPSAGTEIRARFPVSQSSAINRRTRKRKR